MCRGSRQDQPRLRPAFVLVGGEAADQLAGAGIAGHDRLAVESHVAQVKPKALFLDRGAVALEAVGGQQRPDVAGKVDGGLAA